jgi:RTX calcium-binding nonapeptide repeat (4 copies)/Metallo-peptidase family M12B Reprolysin-like
MDIESNPKIRNKSKTLTTAILIILMLSGTAMTASLQIGSVYGQGQATLRVIKEVICELPTVCLIQPSNFRITVTGNNPNPASFDGSAAPGTTVSLGLGSFSVTETRPPPPAGLLEHTSSIGCTGSFIFAGQTRTCRIINAYLQPGGDTDGDGLLNSWEISGIPMTGGGTYVLPQANPLHKNLYVEVDFMVNHRPIGGTLENVTGAFAGSPVTNPDGINGINLFTLVDDEIPHADTTNLNQVQNTIRPTWFGTAAERANTNSVNILAAKAMAFHYTVYAHDQPAPNAGSSGVAQLPGMNALVTLGNNWAMNSAGTHSVGSPDQQEGTFMHEFGHNLGLRHGGIDDINCKPNYFSVQSYLFQMSNYVSNRPLDYSRSNVTALNEASLIEANGLGRSTPTNLPSERGPGDSFTVPPKPAQGPALVGAGTAPVDWNYNGMIDPAPVNVNINKFSSDSNAGCNGFGTQLNGFDDWSNLIYLPTSQQVAEQVVEQDITIEEVRESRLVLLDGINNAIGRLGESIDLSPIAELLQTDQLEAAIAELAELKEQLISQFGEEAANREVVPQIDNLIGALEKQLPSDAPPTPPPASDCVGSGSGNTRIIGTPGPDTLIGTNGLNTINGLGEDDRIQGCEASDRIMGSNGNDGIGGGPGSDELNGNAGNDLIQGDSGNDQLSGGAGINTLTGGPGRDSFICSPDGETTITDFEPGIDRISGPCILADATPSADAGAETSTASSIPLEILPLPLPS